VANDDKQRRDEKAAARDVLLRMALISFYAAGGTMEQARAMCEAVGRSIELAMPEREGRRGLRVASCCLGRGIAGPHTTGVALRARPGSHRGGLSQRDRPRL
jgi:hypothetical protein